MATGQRDEVGHDKRIVVRKGGPYVVHGNVPLVRKTQIVSEHGEPLAWKTEAPIEVREPYLLCRCGQSAHKPLCDGAHVQAGFDGTESADTRATAERRVTMPGDAGIIVKQDVYLCTNSGFCANRATTIQKMAAHTDDTQVRTQAIGMIEHCPSGSLTYSTAEGEADIEPDLPQQVAATTEVTWAGPIAGPLWVSGGISVERADGQPFETRHRVTLCRCGGSKAKPLCDGTHRGAGDGE